MKQISSTNIKYAVRSRHCLEENKGLSVIHKCRKPEYAQCEHWQQYDDSSNLIISSFGTVRRYNKRGGMTEIANNRELKTKISFIYNGKTLYVKRLVAEFFAAIGTGDRIVNINGDIYDNKIDNISYAQSDSIFKPIIPRKSSINIPILQYTLSGNFLCAWQNADEAAERLSFRRGDILMCAEGRVLSAHNFIWTFDTDDRRIHKLPTAYMKAEALQPHLIRIVNKDKEYYFATISAAADLFLISEYEAMKRCMIGQEYDGWKFSCPGESYERSQIKWKD